MLKKGIGILGLTAVIVVSTPAVRAQASEAGVITAMSEKVYLDKSMESTVLANVLQGSVVELIFIETDAEGQSWYYIRTDTGLEGYLPANSAAVLQPQPQESNQQQNEEQDKEPEEPEKEMEEEQTEPEKEAEEEQAESEKEEQEEEQTSEAGEEQASETETTEQSEIPGMPSEQNHAGDNNSGQIIDYETYQAQSKQEKPWQDEVVVQNEQGILQQDQEATQASKKHAGLRLPELFEVGLFAGIFACCGGIAFLVKKVMHML